MKNIINLFDWISIKSGKAVSWLSALLVIVICFDVITRYLFNETQTWMPELEWHLFAAVFLIGAAYTFHDDAHVRVDLFYANKSEKWKAWINLIGILIFLVPWCLVVIRAANKYAYNAFLINETSPDPGGLPGRWIIKYMVVLGFLLLLLQAISVALKCILVIQGKRECLYMVDKKAN